VGKIMADTGTRMIMDALCGGITDAINTAHRKPGYFPDTELPHTVTATTDPDAALNGADFLVLSSTAWCLPGRSRNAGGHGKRPRSGSGPGC
jgi:glycerol-3-phosphate dehydrogenase (NAD(P)+)